MKKLMVALPLFAVATQGLAMNSGFYAGIGLGVQDMFPKITINSVDGTEQESANLDLGKTGPSGALAFGYQLPVTDSFGLGFQIDGQVSNLKTSVVNRSVDGTESNDGLGVKFKYSAGVNVRPSVALNQDASGFLVLGYRHAKMNFSMSEPLGDDVNGSTSRNINSNGFEYGLGTEVSLNQELGLRLEASQTHYQSKAVFVEAGNRNNNLKSKLKTNQALLSLIWYPELG